MNIYKELDLQEYSDGKYSLVPIRYEDRFLIMDWRNQQVYHLRQNQLLTEESLLPFILFAAMNNLSDTNFDAP